VDQWHLITLGLSGVVAVLRFLWRVLKRPDTPSLAGRIWSWSLTTGDRELDNQKLRSQLAARDKLIADLQHDLDRAVGIDSFRESHATEHHHQHSEPLTTPSPHHLTDTTG
jgi:hypothetical protein